MARIFTISFSFEDKLYRSLVTVRTTPYFHEYTLSNLDPAILRLLPGNKIISPAVKQFVFLDARPEHSGVLMKVIMKAVEEHLLVLNGLTGMSSC